MALLFIPATLNQSFQIYASEPNLRAILLILISKEQVLPINTANIHATERHRYFSTSDARRF